MNYNVFVEFRAEQEIAEIASWIADRSIDGALRWLDRVEHVKQSLAVNPEGCPLSLEDELADHEIREMSFKTRRGRRYRAVFTIRGDTVHVLHVRGPGQKPLSADELNVEDT